MQHATIGRIVHVTFSDERLDKRSHQGAEGQSRTVPAIIVGVHSDECVNLQVFVDGRAGTLWLTSLTHKTVAPNGATFWEWPKVAEAPKPKKKAGAKKGDSG